MSRERLLVGDKICCRVCLRPGWFPVITRLHGELWGYHCWWHYIKHLWWKLKVTLLTPWYRWKIWKREFKLWHYPESVEAEFLPAIAGHHKSCSTLHCYWIRLGRWELRWIWDRL